jgi:dGTP triphosphohydrolase
MENDNTLKASTPSTYTESHRKYYQRYKALINARRKKYMKEYKQQWYKRNRDRIMAAKALKRLAEKGL